MPPTSVHFNGSVNLPDAEAVMREISSRIPNGVRRMTDGETGDRNYWISLRCIERVAADVPVGMHLCYGDYGHQHFKQPESLQMQVDLVNAVISAARRSVNFVSFTVPQGRNDSAYFEPLGGLTVSSDTELYFALVPYHPDDQPPDTTAEQIEQIDGALVNSPGGARHWGVCTECGMGRVDAGDVPALLDLHSQILAASRD